MFLARTRPLALAASTASLALALTACGSADDPEQLDGAPTSSATPAEPLSPTGTEPATVEPTGAPEGDTVEPDDQDEVVTAAIEDLAQREGVAPDDVSVVSDTQVEWSSGALGCPQPGQFYTQVITPGRQILLEVGGREFAYHAGETGPAAYCENPETPTAE